ncbi:hypothetical protein KFU94_02100 [Chloroflexi bacterium TSY]|nr:hypothetical protein [Chloroflexi bacterium TSY]
MATSNIIDLKNPTSRQRIHGYPRDSIRFDLAVAVLSGVFLVDLYFDGWAHNNIPNLIETFFTPFHTLLYGGFFLVATLLTATHLRNIARGHS